MNKLINRIPEDSKPFLPDELESAKFEEFGPWVTNWPWRSKYAECIVRLRLLRKLNKAKARNNHETH